MIDAASDDALQQRHTVLRTLRDLGMSEEDLRVRVLEVWNKADCLQTIPADPPQPARPQPCDPKPGPGSFAGCTSSVNTQLEQQELWAAVCARIQAAASRSGRSGARELAKHLAEAWQKRPGAQETTGSAGTSGAQVEDSAQRWAAGGAGRMHPAAPDSDVAEACSPPESLEAEATTGPGHDRGEPGMDSATRAVGRQAGSAWGSTRLQELMAPAALEVQEEVLETAPAGACENRAPQEQLGTSASTVPLVVSATTGLGLERLRHFIHERLALLGRPETACDGG